MDRRIFFTSFSRYIDYAPSDADGFTDILSNAVVLNGLNPLDHIDEIRQGSLDLTYLPNILHECTHHATFNSPVGCALAALWASSQTNWIQQVGKSHPTLASRDLAVFQTARTLLTPLAEGLALFAEHDLICGPAPILSNVSQHAMLLFTKGRLSRLLDGLCVAPLRAAVQPQSEDVLSRTHTALLEEARRHSAWLERKAHLLSQPIDGPHRYLLGYLAVKAMYRALSKSVGELMDPEAFFLLLIRHFFHNEELAQTLANLIPDNVEPQEAYLRVGVDLQGVVERIQDLFDALYADTKEAIAHALLPLLTTSGALPLTREDPHATEGRLPLDLDFLLGIRTVGMLNVAWPRLMKHRPEFRFSCLAVEVEVTADGIAIVRAGKESKEVLRTPAVVNADRGVYEGTVEAIRLRNIRTTVICVLSSHGLVAVLDCDTGKWNAPELSDHLDDLPSAIAVEGAMHAHAEQHDLVGHCGTIRDMLQGYQRQADQGALSMYLQLACPGWQAPRRQTIFELTSEKGLAGLFGDGERFLRVCQISSLVGLASNVESVAQALETNVKDFMAEIDGINAEARDAGGFPPFELHNRWLLSMI